MNKNNIYNQTVSDVYGQIISLAKDLISTIEVEALRGVLDRQDEPQINGGYIVHELINPLIYVRLEAYKDDMLGIHYGYG